MATKAVESEITILEVQKGEMEFCILGTSPFLSHAMPPKAWHELLAPAGKKGAAEKASTMKHDPVQEFRDSIYRLKDDGPTLIATKTTGFKKAMQTAALDTPGTKKTQIGRLVTVHGELTPLFGIPQLHMTIVRSADMNIDHGDRSRGRFMAPTRGGCTAAEPDEGAATGGVGALTGPGTAADLGTSTVAGLDNRTPTHTPLAIRAITAAAPRAHTPRPRPLGSG